jgi:hypothetical protein
MDPGRRRGLSLVRGNRQRLRHRGGAIQLHHTPDFFRRSTERRAGEKVAGLVEGQTHA